jgi:RNA polymerase sigma-70 factor (ECF subfamily)
VITFEQFSFGLYPIIALQTVDERVTGSLHRIALARAIQELPAGYRTIFLLHEIKGYEHPEIARILRCSVGNSKSQLHRARLRMRGLLGSAASQGEGSVHESRAWTRR